MYVYPLLWSLPVADVPIGIYFMDTCGLS